MTERNDQADQRAEALASRWREAADRFITTVVAIDGRRWEQVPDAGVWSIGKEVEHVIEAAAYHQWIVRRTIGDKVPSRKPVLERKQMTSNLSPSDAADLLRQRRDDGVQLIGGLTDEQLDLPTRPPRANDPPLAVTIAGMLIRHVDGHHADILAKLEALDRGNPQGAMLPSQLPTK
jgi:hypothetical protein